MKNTTKMTAEELELRNKELWAKIKAKHIAHFEKTNNNNQTEGNSMKKKTIFKTPNMYTKAEKAAAFQIKKADAYTITTNGNVVSMKWNNNDASKHEIEQILIMKVGKRCPKNDIYFRVNEYCNNFDMNSSADFLYKKCFEQFKNEVTNKNELDSIIWTVLD